MQLASAALLLLAVTATVLGGLAVPVGDDAPASNDGPVEDGGGRDLADMARDGAHKMADMAHEGLNKMVELAKSAGHKMADMAHAVKEELAGEEPGAHQASGDEAKAGQGAESEDGHVKALVGCADADGGCGGGNGVSRMRRSAQHESEGERRRREVSRMMRALLERRHYQVRVMRLVAEQEAHRRHLTDPTDNSHDHDVDGQYEHGGLEAPDAHVHEQHDHFHDAMDDVHGEGHLHGHQDDADHHDDHDHEDALSSHHEQNEHDMHEGHSEHEHDDHHAAAVADSGVN